MDRELRLVDRPYEVNGGEVSLACPCRCIGTCICRWAGEFGALPLSSVIVSVSLMFHPARSCWIQRMAQDDGVCLSRKSVVLLTASGPSGHFDCLFATFVLFEISD